MEYLEMHGAVKLKADGDMETVKFVIRELGKIEFSDSGSIDILLKGRRIGISAEGTVSESYSIRALLEKLQGQLSDRSVIGITRDRWEIFVILKHWEPQSVLRLQPQEQLVSVQ